MPFITNTGLRDLKHSEFGTIGDPLVIKDLPDVNQDGPGKGFAQQISSRADDAVRMSRLLVLNQGKRTEAGNKFLANLALINQQATLAKVQKKDFSGLGTTALQGAADTGKVIASTLAQVPVAGTGTHFVNGGKVGKEYLEGGGNAVGQLLRAIGGGGGGLQGHERVLSGNAIEINKQAVDEGEESLLRKYKGKVESVDEIGKPEDYGIGDKNLRQPYKNRNNPDTAFFTRLSKQGDQGKDVGGSDEAVDRLNKSDVLLGAGFNKEDIIPFELQIFNPINGGAPRFLYFRAYINSFSDNYTGEWNATSYVGRAEKLYNYTGFNRQINLSFIVAAHTKSELMPLYKKLNYLVGSTAPSYDTNLTFMRGVYTRVTVGDYLTQVPGFFNSINVDWNPTFPWEIGLNSDYSENNSPKVPHLLNVSLNFTPVHDFNPEIERPFITNDTFIPFEKEATSGQGTSIEGRRLDESTTQNGYKPGLGIVDETDMPPSNQPGRFRQGLNNASAFIQKNILVDQGTRESVKTVSLAKDDTVLALDQNLEDILNA